MWFDTHVNLHSERFDEDSARALSNVRVKPA